MARETVQLPFLLFLVRCQNFYTAKLWASKQQCVSKIETKKARKN
jgi:hypothetical protein